jgi:hypothetical protein
MDDEGGTFKERFKRLDARGKRASFRVSRKNAKAFGAVGSQTVYAPDGTAVGKVTRVVESSNGESGSVDVEVEFHAENDKVAAGVWAGVSCTMAPTGGSVISLTDQLSSDPTGLPWEKLSKADRGEGYTETADLLKRKFTQPVRVG